MRSISIIADLLHISIDYILMPSLLRISVSSVAFYILSTPFPRSSCSHLFSQFARENKSNSILLSDFLQASHSITRFDFLCLLVFFFLITWFRLLSTSTFIGCLFLSLSDGFSFSQSIFSAFFQVSVLNFFFHWRFPRSNYPDTWQATIVEDDKTFTGINTHTHTPCSHHTINRAESRYFFANARR